ncbi:MAG: hypothetical protein ACM3KM_02330 [Acidobacteriaceae bacterium]
MGNQIPNIPIAGIIQIIFYIVVMVFTIGSALSIYSLLRFGRNRAAVFPAIITYVAISMVLFFVAVNQLSRISFQ